MERVGAPREHGPVDLSRNHRLVSDRHVTAVFTDDTFNPVCYHLDS